MSKIKYWFSQPLPVLLLIQTTLFVLYHVFADDTFMVIQQCIWVSIVAVTIHELGHLIVGRFMGMELHFMSAGFVLLVPASQKNSNLRIRLNRALPLSFGLTSMYMNDSSENERRMRNRLIPYVLGGIAANVLVVLLCVLLKYMVAGKDFLLEWLNYLITFNAILGVASALPFIRFTDAWACLQLYKMNKESLFSFRVRNLYFHPDRIIEDSELREWKQKACEMMSTESIYYLGLLEATNQVRNKHDLQAIHSLQISADILEDGSQQIPATVLHFYRIMLASACQREMNESDFKIISSISLIYGKIFYLLSRGVMACQEGDKQLGLALLEDALTSKHEMMDYNQEDLIEYIVGRIKSEMKSV